jgi:dTMP kinase
MVISFEGLDSTGKTTQLNRLQWWLLKMGISCFSTHAEGSLKSISLQSALSRIGIDLENTDTQFMLWITQTLNSKKLFDSVRGDGRVLLVDRAIDTCIVYSRLMRDGLDEAFYKTVNTALLRFGPKPDLTIWLRVPPGVRKDRILSNRQDIDEFDPEHDQLLDAEFAKIALQEVNRFRVVECGSKDVDEVFEMVREIVQREYFHEIN